MRRALWIGGVFVLAAAGLCVISGVSDGPSAAALADASNMSLEDYMYVVHGTKGLHTLVKEAVTGSGPADEKAWKTVKARAATITYLAEQVLAKAKPDKGDAASWRVKTGDYQAAAKALAKAAGAKDMDEIKAQAAKLTKMCEGCHKAHK